MTGVFVIILLALAVGLFLDTVAGRGAGDSLPWLGNVPEEGGWERLSQAEALGGSGGLLLLGLGLALAPGHVLAGGLLAAGGLCLLVWRAAWRDR